MPDPAHAPAPEAPARVVVRSRSPEETRDLAAAMAAVAAPGDRLALLGPLGAGKTQFAKGFALGLGVTDVVNSPSFTLMAEYAGRLPLFHQDLYRLDGAEDAVAGGMLDERQDDGVTLTEWAERLGPGLDVRRLDVRLDLGPGDERIVTLEARGDAALARYVDAAAAWASARRTDDETRVVDPGIDGDVTRGVPASRAS